MCVGVCLPCTARAFKAGGEGGNTAKRRIRVSSKRIFDQTFSPGNDVIYGIEGDRELEECVCVIAEEEEEHRARSYESRLLE